MNFNLKLQTAMTANKSLLCVGLDTDFAKLPSHLQDCKLPLFTFNKAIVEATADLVCAYKPNSAFYEAHGADGIAQLKMTIDYINQQHPKIPIILDSKRADIGNTNNGYGEFAFNYLVADALTVHPYLGGEALQPLLDHKDKGIVVLCRTSNPGAGEFQDLLIDGKPLYQHVAQQVAANWDTSNNCLLVVGATYPEEMKIIRELVGPNMVFLVPGIGAQGGDISAVMPAGLGLNKNELIINSGREILYASSGEDFAEAARQQAIKTRNEINKYR